MLIHPANYAIHTNKTQWYSLHIFQKSKRGYKCKTTHTYYRGFEGSLPNVHSLRRWPMIYVNLCVWLFWSRLFREFKTFLESVPPAPFHANSLLHFSLNPMILVLPDRWFAAPHCPSHIVLKVRRRRLATKCVTCCLVVLKTQIHPTITNQPSW